MGLDSRKAFAGVLVAVVAVLGLAAVVGSTQPKVGNTADCGFLTSCEAIDSNGLALSLSMNSTLVRSNGSFTLVLALSNPTLHVVQVSRADSWYVPFLNDSWPCGVQLAPYGYVVYRGYYTVSNISLGRDVLRQPNYFCIETGTESPSSYSVPPVWSSSVRVYAIDGGWVSQGSYEVGVTSLGSSSPGVYTIAAGDEWGSLVLLHFSVLGQHYGRR